MDARASELRPDLCKRPEVARRAGDDNERGRPRQRMARLHALVCIASWMDIDAPSLLQMNVTHIQGAIEGWASIAMEASNGNRANTKRGAVAAKTDAGTEQESDVTEAAL